MILFDHAVFIWLAALKIDGYLYYVGIVEVKVHKLMWNWALCRGGLICTLPMLNLTINKGNITAKSHKSLIFQE